MHEAVEIIEANNANTRSFRHGNRALGHVIAGTRRRRHNKFVYSVTEKVSGKIDNTAKKAACDIRRHGRLRPDHPRNRADT